MTADNTTRAAARVVAYPAGMTLTDGAAAMVPPMPRRELARRMAGVTPLGTVRGARGRRPQTYPTDAILRAHADWLRAVGKR